MAEQNTFRSQYAKRAAGPENSYRAASSPRRRHSEGSQARRNTIELGAILAVANVGEDSMANRWPQALPGEALLPSPCRCPRVETRGLLTRNLWSLRSIPRTVPGGDYPNRTPTVMAADWTKPTRPGRPRSVVGHIGHSRPPARCGRSCRSHRSDSCYGRMLLRPKPVLDLPPARSDRFCAFSPRRTKPLRGGPKVCPCPPCLHSRLSPFPYSSRLLSPSGPVLTPPVQARLRSPIIEGADDVLGVPRLTEREAARSAAPRMTEDLILHNRSPRHRLYINCVAISPVLSHLARTTRARARPLLLPPSRRTNVRQQSIRVERLS